MSIAEPAKKRVWTGDRIATTLFALAVIAFFVYMGFRLSNRWNQARPLKGFGEIRMIRMTSGGWTNVHLQDMALGVEVPNTVTPSPAVEAYKNSDKLEGYTGYDFQGNGTTGYIYTFLYRKPIPNFEKYIIDRDLLSDTKAGMNVTVHNVKRKTFHGRPALDVTVEGEQAGQNIVRRSFKILGTRSVRSFDLSYWPTDRAAGEKQFTRMVKSIVPSQDLSGGTRWSTGI